MSLFIPVIALFITDLFGTGLNINGGVSSSSVAITKTNNFMQNMGSTVSIGMQLFLLILGIAVTVGIPIAVYLNSKSHLSQKHLKSKKDEGGFKTELQAITLAILSFVLLSFLYGIMLTSIGIADNAPNAFKKVLFIDRLYPEKSFTQKVEKKFSYFKDLKG